MPDKNILRVLCNKVNGFDRLAERINDKIARGFRLTKITVKPRRATVYHTIVVLEFVPEPAQNPNNLAVIGRDEPEYRKANG